MRRMANKDRPASPTPVSSPRQTPGGPALPSSAGYGYGFGKPAIQVTPTSPRPSVSMPSTRSKANSSSNKHSRTSTWSLSEPSRDLMQQLSGSTVFTSEEINRLGRRFRKLDSDLSGALSMDEFLQLPEIRSNPLAQRLVQTFDNDGNGVIDFREFVLGMSQFSVKGNQEARLRFAFRVYDIDNDGKISNGELFQVLKMMTADNLMDIQLQQLVDHTILLGNNGSGNSINYKQFVALVERGTGASVHKKMVISGI